MESINLNVPPQKLIEKLTMQNMNLNLQVQMLTVALEEEVAKNKKDGVDNGNAEPTEAVPTK